jgi:hypothetical protein
LHLQNHSPGQGATEVVAAVGRIDERPSCEVDHGVGCVQDGHRLAGEVRAGRVRQSRHDEDVPGLEWSTARGHSGRGRVRRDDEVFRPGRQLDLVTGSAPDLVDVAVLLEAEQKQPVVTMDGVGAEPGVEAVEVRSSAGEVRDDPAEQLRPDHELFQRVDAHDGGGAVRVGGRARPQTDRKLGSTRGRDTSARCHRSDTVSVP